MKCVAYESCLAKHLLMKLHHELGVPEEGQNTLTNNQADVVHAQVAHLIHVVHKLAVSL